MDIDKYNDEDDVLFDVGWKRLSRDVFRPPDHPMFLSVTIGVGVQLTTMILMAIVFIMLSFKK